MGVQVSEGPGDEADAEELGHKGHSGNTHAIVSPSGGQAGRGRTVIVERPWTGIVIAAVEVAIIAGRDGIGIRQQVGMGQLQSIIQHGDMPARTLARVPGRGGIDSVKGVIQMPLVNKLGIVGRRRLGHPILGELYPPEERRTLQLGGFSDPLSRVERLAWGWVGEDPPAVGSGGLGGECAGGLLDAGPIRRPGRKPGDQSFGNDAHRGQPLEPVITRWKRRPLRSGAFVSDIEDRRRLDKSRLLAQGR